MSASRRVTRAVNGVLDLAPRSGEVSLARLIEAVAADRGRPIELKMAELPPGVCGQWRQYVDRDVFLIQEGLPAGDRTLAPSAHPPAGGRYAWHPGRSAADHPGVAHHRLGGGATGPVAAPQTPASGRIPL